MTLGQGTQVILTIDQGCDFQSDTYVWMNGDGGSLGGDGSTLKLDTTTAIAKFRVSGQVVLTLTDTSGITLDRTTSGDTMGEYSFVVTKAQTALLPPGRCDFDLLLTDTVSQETLKAIYSQPFVRPTQSLTP